MVDEKEAGGEPDAMTADEAAFFESGGEKQIPSTEAPVVEKPVEDQTAQAEIEGAGKAKTVPHATFHAEREEHKKTKAELAELREFRAAMDERMRWFEAAQQQQQPAKDDTPPDPNVDVFAALKWTQDKLLASEKTQNEALQQQQRQQQEQQAEQQVWTYWQQDAASYTKENPDFGNAAKWLSDYRDKQLTALSVADTRFATPQARNTQIETELKGIIIAAAQQRRSPAELVYEIAKGYGYQMKPAEAAAVAGGLNERIEQLDKAQSANRTVGAAPGNAGGDEMTAEALANMPEQEFAVWMAKPENAAKFRKLMG